MQGWMKKNQKKLLAVMGAFLMVSFLITVPLGSLTSGGRNRGPAVAHLGKTEIFADDQKQAENEWRMIEQSYYIDRTEGRFKRATDLVGPAIASQMKDHPELFLLLSREAESRGIDVSKDLLETVLTNKIHSAVGQPVSDAYRSAIRHLLMVQALRDQLVSDVKFSEPQWKHGFAAQYRQIRLSLVQFSAEQLSRSTPSPTTQQVQAMFEQYKNVLPGAPATRPSEGELSFGYEVPNRVKLQYVTISRDQVVKAARDAHRDANDKPGQLPYDLKVKAIEYYMQNQTEFVRSAPETQPETRPATSPATAATEPATGPTTAVATTAATAPAATSQQTAAQAGPTTRPFAEVQDEIVTKLLKPDADELEKKVADAVRAKLTLAIAPHAGATQPAGATTLPTTQPAADYADLEKIRQEIQQQFNVSVEITQTGEWQDSKSLAALAGIGGATADKTPFAEYVMDNAAAFVADPARKAAALKIGQPSPLLTDSHDNDYVFRLADVSPAHAPDLASVLPRVEEDARAKAAFDRANDQAKKFLDLAQRNGFQRAALDDNHPVISTGDFSLRQLSFLPIIPNFKASSESIAILAEQCKALLDKATPANPNPMAVVPMPADKIVVVAQLADVMIRMPEEMQYTQRLQADRSISLGDSEQLAEEYFNYDTVVKRLDYKPENPDKSSGS